MKPYLVFAGTNGRCAVYGYSNEEPKCLEKKDLYNARMVLRWQANCGGVFGLSCSGPKEGTKLTKIVEKTGIDVVRQWLSVTDEARKVFDEWPAEGEDE